MREDDDIGPQGFAERVAFLRQRIRDEHGRKLSQAAFGKLLGVGKNAVYNWEAGTSLPKATQLAQLAKRLHVSVEWLMQPGAAPQAQRAKKTRDEVSDAVAGLDVAVGRLKRALSKGEPDTDEISELATRKRGAKGTAG